MTTNSAVCSDGGDPCVPPATTAKIDTQAYAWESSAEDVRAIKEQDTRYFMLPGLEDPRDEPINPSPFQQVT